MKYIILVILLYPLNSFYGILESYRRNSVTLSNNVEATIYKDKDGDGYGDPTKPKKLKEGHQIPKGYSFVNTDCNDDAATTHPGAPELCDFKDNNCDGQKDEAILYYRDSDNDGYGNTFETKVSCIGILPVGYVDDNSDCKDDNPDIHPGATELCDGIDNNCNGPIDELNLMNFFYKDEDGDGHGTFLKQLLACTMPLGYVTSTDDCNDDDPAIYPGAPELCDEKDNNCDGRSDENFNKTYFYDRDMDGLGDPESQVTGCTRPIGTVDNFDDCDDTNPDIRGEIPSYGDRDGDGFGDPRLIFLSCTPPPGFVNNNTDCDDLDANIHPGAIEICGNHIDEDCIGGDMPCPPLSGCPAPSSLTTSNIILSSATLTWSPVQTANQYMLEWRRGNSNQSFNQVFLPGTSFTLTNLSNNTEYEARVQTLCNGTAGEYTSIKSFTTAPCPTPGAISISVTSNSAFLSWDVVPEASQYIVEWRPADPPGFFSFNQVVVPGAFISLTGLNPAARYEARVSTSCGGGGSEPTAIQSFMTAGASPLMARNRHDANSMDLNMASPGNKAVELNVMPNPIKGKVAFISFRVPETGKSRIRIVDLNGRTVQILELGNQKSGSHRYNLTNDVSNGLYIIVLEQNNKVIARKKILVGNR
jgi:hypothetical protein